MLAIVWRNTQKFWLYLQIYEEVFDDEAYIVESFLS